MRVGRLGRPHGLDGFIGLYVEPEDLEYFQPGSEVVIAESTLVVDALRRGKKGHQVRFRGFTSRDDSEALRGASVMALERRRLASNEYWPRDLVGLEVRPGGGVVAAVNHGAAQDRLVIEREGMRFEVPFVFDLVPVVDVDRGFVEVVEIEGLSPPQDRQ